MANSTLRKIVTTQNVAMKLDYVEDLTSYYGCDRSAAGFLPK